MNIQVLLKREIEREKKLASLTAKRYDILRVLYTGHEYILTELKGTLNNLEDKTIDLGNLSRYITRLDDNGLVLKEDGKIKISSSAQEIVYAIMEAARPEEEKPWLPQQGDINLCISFLEDPENEKIREAFLFDLGDILKSGYWDNKLGSFFSKALENSERYGKEIDVLLQARPRNQENIEVFFKKKKDKIFDLVKSSDRHSILALSIFVDASDEGKVIDMMEKGLEEEGAERIIIAAHGCGQKLYEKFGLDFKKFLSKALVHESEKVKNFAVAIMREQSTQC